MTIRIVPKKPRRGLILITPYKKISDFRSVGIGNNPLDASRRDAISISRMFADNHLLFIPVTRCMPSMNRISVSCFDMYPLSA